MENERKNKIEYHKEGDYYVPNLVVAKDEYPDYCIGKYGRLRLKYLKENKKVEYTIMLVEGTLRKHIVETDMEATEDDVRKVIQRLCETDETDIDKLMSTFEGMEFDDVWIHKWETANMEDCL